MKQRSLLSTRGSRLKTQSYDTREPYASEELTSEPFPKYERAKRVSHMLEMTPEKWNHAHLDSLLRKSAETQAVSPAKSLPKSGQSTVDSKYPKIKNMCRYGFTNVFPLVPKATNGYLTRVLTDYDVDIKPPQRENNDDSIERPFNPQQRLQQMQALKAKLTKYQDCKTRRTRQLRLKQILSGSYPHGVQAREHTVQACNKKQKLIGIQITFNDQRRQRANLMHQKFNHSNLFNASPDYSSFPKQTFDLSPLMKSKKHIPQQKESSSEDFHLGGKRMRLRPQSLAGYDIITNLQNS